MKLKKIAIALLASLTIFTTSAIITPSPLTIEAHSGRTDSNGGHHDYKNKSGLGSYHYHHGMGPHLHPGGVCPYSGTSSSSQSDSSSQPATQPPSKPSPSISIKNYPKTLNVGDNAGFEYSVSNATNSNTTISSSNSSVVTVNKNGVLSGVGVGKAEITVSASGATKSFTVEVKAVPVESIDITNEIDKIQLGESYQFKASVLPNNATDKEVSWSSDNENILKIDSDGSITTNSAGTVTIACTSKNNIEVKTTVEIFEILPESVSCEDSIVLIVGDECDFNINILPENANNKEFTVSCKNKEILNYKDSSLKALSEGDTILHIETWNGIEKDIPVKVDIVPVKNIEIEDSTQYMFSNIIDKSDNILLSSEISPGNATYQDVVWSSSNEDIVSVQNGKFIINGTGKVTLICTAHGGIVNSLELQIIDKNIIFVIILLSIIILVIVVILIMKRNKKQKTLQ